MVRQNISAKPDFYVEESDPLIEENIRSAQELLASDRSRAIATLNLIFRTGKLPSPRLEGFYQGELIAIDIAPGLSQFYELLSKIWMPWKGKIFIPEREAGYNLIPSSSRPLFKIVWPFYSHYVKNGQGGYQAFPFRTYPGPGRVDPDRQVLKLDYNLKVNPALNVRRLLDELVQLEEGLYLGKAHLKWWWGWKQVAFFALRKT